VYIPFSDRFFAKLGREIMPAITDQAPPAVAKDMAALGAYLDQAIPRKKAGDNLLIATWNLRAFASLTREWTATAKDSPKRDLRGLLAIGEIVRRFDVIAIQEVKGDLRALRDLLRWLGEDWAFLMTDITLGSSGNDERMAFLFDTTRLKPSGLACELVVPPEWLGEIGPDALRRQFARTPYAVSFKAADTTFILVTLHVTFGNPATERVPELRGIARWMREWANQANAWSQNLIALGDFNIDRQGDPLWQVFVSTGLAAPEALNKAPRTVFSDPGKPETNKFYDQIAWFQTAAGVPKLAMTFRAAGHVDFLPYVYTDIGLSKQSISYRLSDHFPLWAEFALA
jgi:endonuclease/exonuclease/phosphatase family metal-dependent hydrolase